jgi:hypothetical protein
MLNGNGALDTQTHRLIRAMVNDLPTTEMQALADPSPPPPITGMHRIERPSQSRRPG